MNTPFSRWVHDVWVDKVLMWGIILFYRIKNKAVRSFLVIPCGLFTLATILMLLFPTVLLMLIATALELINKP